MLIRWIGAALLVGACSAVGLGQSRRLRERVRYLNTCLMRLERMKTEVCRLYTPLLSALELLCGAKFGEGELREHSFAELWSREVTALGLPKPETEALNELGCALSRGDEPERSFDAAMERMRSLLRAAENEAEGKCRLCSCLGICAGILLVIVLI